MTTGIKNPKHLHLAAWSYAQAARFSNLSFRVCKIIKTSNNGFCRL